MPAFESGQALVMGVGSYSDPSWNVPAAARDAQAIFAALTGPGGYRPGAAELLLDATVTRAALLAALRRLADRCTAASVALISLTCHGAPGEDGLYYLATGETRFAPDGRIVAGSGLHTGELARALRDIPAGRLLLIVNACGSGRLLANLRGEALAANEPPAATAPPDADVDALLATGTGRAVLTASRGGQPSSFLPDAQHTYFGQALLDALAGSASARRYLGLFELYELVYRQVVAATQQRLSSPQEPALNLVEQVGPFPLALNPAARGDETAIGQTPPVGTAIRLLPQTIVQAHGPGATAVNAGPGSNVVVDNSKLIDFGNASVMGSVRVGDVAKGDIIKIGAPAAEPAASDEQATPLQLLPILRERVAVARNVDEDARDDAANKLNQALRALTQGDTTRARTRIEEALALLVPMNNGYVNSVVRKLQALRDGL